MRSASDNPNVASAQAMADILKLITSLATGALVFSIDLTTSGTTIYTSFLQIALIVSWASFAVSIASGIWTLSYMPALVRDESLTIDSMAVRIPTMVSQGVFCIGAVVLAVVLVETFKIEPVLAKQRVRSPSQAVSLAATRMLKRYCIIKVDVVELVKGIDLNRELDDTWHVQFDVAQVHRQKGSHPIVLDVYLNPTNGDTYIPEAH